MNLCAIICEYNPFHNGHEYLIREAKRLSGCDGVLCIMSGSFTQRGEITVMDKFTRAAHAVKGGADAVIQLPVSFSVAPAEIFASGAIKLLNSIPDVRTIAFGCENADKKAILKSAAILADESEKYKSVLKSNLDRGESYTKSAQAALDACGGDGMLLSGSNNILALEYAKAIIKTGSNIDIIPVKRKGCNYNDDALGQNYSSARAIRENITDISVKNNVPDYVYGDIKKINDYNTCYGKFLHYALINNTAESMGNIFGCSEGIENKLKSLAHEKLTAEEIVGEATSKRYTSSRIMRIMCANLLGLYENDCRQYLSSPLYIKPLAVNSSRSDEILASLSRSAYPVIIRKNDMRALCDAARKCLEKDDFADEVRAIIFGEKIYNYTIKNI